MGTTLLVMAMYFPPKMQEGAKAETRYRRTTQDSIDWASGVIPEAPHRTLAIIGSDLNDGLGMCQRQRQRSVARSNGRLAEEGCADTLFRLMLEELKLFVAGGHTDETITPPQSTRTYEDDRLRYHPSVVCGAHHTNHRSPTQVEGLYSMRR